MSGDENELREPGEPLSPGQGQGQDGDPEAGRPGQEPAAADADSGTDSGSAGTPPVVDEDTLRRLLHQTVGDLEPSPATLEHLRRAVPRRRARKRQALVGAAAAVVLGGAAIPALLHADLVPGGGNKPMHAASHSESHGPDDEQGGRNGGNDDEDAHQGKENAGKDGRKSGGGDTSSPSAGGDTKGPGPSDDTYASAPTCAGDQLGRGTANVGQPDGEGRIYGSFEVTNTSAEPCSVEGEGIVGASARGRASSSNIQVMDHTPGDGTGLPDPGMAAEELVLEPGASYVVKFAWVPREGGGPTGCSTSTTPPPDSGDTTEGGEGTPDPGGSAEGGDGTADTGGGGGDSGTTGGASSGTGTDTGGGGETGGASVALSHTPDVGNTAAASTVLPGACAGTVYRTGVLAGQ
ncbi:hypothetical protein DVA86_31270 [Streptomyces armeniacus]|uniref:DUF4232 domain-containing protein n=1 Tax=Streptomyces armeniacus TaxID=83291 RepID=A0A345XXN4_9ACTN|nr:DUF4232 domain-containing protein [Streptomyces armeniacus]AXK36400.1 hypothetical protein DVA86_31270 [Streptomyces armeniacus]